MGIEHRHAYRFEFLKSEQWQTVRAEALARERGCCQICREHSLSNDAHHVIYPPSVWDTKASDLAILCRPCHDLMHRILEIHRLKVHTENQFSGLCEAVISWKRVKEKWIKTAESKLVCGICKQPCESVSKWKFFGKFSKSHKFSHAMCDNCIQSAKVAVADLIARPEKSHKIYEQWKKARSFDGPIEYQIAKSVPLCSTNLGKQV